MKQKKKTLIIVTLSIIFAVAIVLAVCLTVLPKSCSETDGGNSAGSAQGTPDSGNDDNTGDTDDDKEDNDTTDKDQDGDKEEKPPHEHDYKTSVVEPTCTEQGYTLHACACGESYKDTYIDASHKYTQSVTDPTCTEKGYTSYTCSACGDGYIGDYVNAKGHTEETVKGTAPTCLLPGTTDGVRCSECGTVLEEQTDIEPLDHNYVNYVCNRCGALDPNMPDSQGLDLTYNYSTNSYTLKSVGECTDKVIKVPSQYKGSPVTSIGQYAFEYSGVKYVSLPNSVTELQDHAFSNCSALTEVKLPEGISIGESAFSVCSKLESIVIPDGVTSIGNYAFQNCTSLKHVTFGKDVTGFGSYTFASCDALEAINVSPENTRYSSRDGILYNKAQTSINLIPQSVKGDIIIPDTVWNVSGVTFQNKTGLTSVKLPEALQDIPSSFFKGCTALKSVSIPDGVKTISTEAFSGCSSLESLNTPDSLTSIGNSAFSGCDKLIRTEDSVKYVDKWVIGRENGVTDIVLHSYVKGLADWAFYNCKTLESIVISEGVTAAGIWAFKNCTSLTDIYYGGTKESWNAIKKASYWNDGTGNYTVHCSDGDIAK